MTAALWLLWVALTTSPDDGARLRRTAPSYLTIDVAREHYAAARIASALTGERVELLLAVAWHESRYDVSAVTAEPGRRVSCGVMTPEPVKVCPPATLVGGYVAGARHLAWWRRIYRDDLRALTAYAGGGTSVRACAGGAETRVCAFADVILRRARLIAHRSS